MFRARDPQRSLFSARNQYRDSLDDDSFYALLADHAEELFDDYQFEYLYFENNGRPCIPPGQMFTLLLLQMHDGCSDKETVERARFDLRWLAALDLEPAVRLCGQSTLQEFRARVLLHEVAEKQFKSILGLARKLGIIKGPLQVAMDTTPIFGRGAVKDTYNLIGDGIRKVVQTLAKMERVTPEHWARLHDFGRYFDASSLKGEAEIAWDDDAQRRVFLNSLVADADRLLMLADALAKTSTEEHAAQIVEASALLRRIITQDTEPDPDPPKPGGTDGGDSRAEGDTIVDPTQTAEPSEGATTNSHLLGEMVRLRKGTAKERVLSVHDPEMRHGRKSASNLFNGYKLSIVNDVETGLILSLDLLSGNSGDNEGALDLIGQAQENTGLSIKKAVGDCAYGDGATRQAFHDSNIDLSAKVPASRKDDSFPKSRFTLDLTNMIATCPEGKTTTQYECARSRQDREPTPRFRFHNEDCADCSHRNQCLRAVDKRRGWGRSLALHPQEGLLQQARRHQSSPEFRGDIRIRQTAERSLARCIQLGARQARYLGKRKTKYQMVMIALAANLGVIRRVVFRPEHASGIMLIVAEWCRAPDWCRSVKSRKFRATIPILRPHIGVLDRVA